MKIELNVVFLGGVPFPKGYAMTKRWRYLIDYMDNNDIVSHVLVVNRRYDSSLKNPLFGLYGKYCDYADISRLIKEKQYYKAIHHGKLLLKRWLTTDKRNILILTRVTLDNFFLVKNAYELGYTIVPDIVETSYLKSTSRRSLMSTVLQATYEKLTQHVIRKYAKGCFVISSNLEKELLQFAPNLHICILQNSTPVLSKESKKSLNNPLRVLYSGTYAEKDGVNYLIDGVVKAHGRGCDCELFLLGKGNEEDMHVLSRTEDKGYIHYLGFVSDEDLCLHLQSSDVLCMTRTNTMFANYGFPFKLSEYLSTGNIVLATRVGDVPKYITDRKDCYLINPESTEQIADTLLYIVQHPEESLNIAAEGLKTMKRVFSKDVVGKRFVDFLYSV